MSKKPGFATNKSNEKAVQSKKSTLNTTPLYEVYGDPQGVKDEIVDLMANITSGKKWRIGLSLSFLKLLYETFNSDPCEVE